MPGPVSDSYDPEFGTGENASDVQNAIETAKDKLGEILGPELKYIVDVAQGPAGRTHSVKLTERDCRALRFAANRALESI